MCLAPSPGGLFAYGCSFFGISYGLPDIAEEIRYANDFSSHYFFGPLVVFLWFGVAAAAAVYLGLKVAPSRKIIAVVILGVLFAGFLGAGVFGLFRAISISGVMWESVARTTVEFSGAVVGFFAGVLAAKDAGEFKNDT